MSFLAPWLLWAGLGAVSLPILFHLFRRTPRGKMPFSTLMFLTPTPPRVTRRSRLENWPLLLLRALVLVLLGLAFGRPLWRQLLESSGESAAAVRTVLLVDTSASMRRGDAWNRALAEARRIVDATGPNDELAVMAVDSAPRVRLPFKEWRAAPAGERSAAARAALGELAPTWGGSRLDHGLIEAAEMLETADDVRREPGAVQPGKRIVLVTDLQSGARITGLEGYEWPKQVDVQVVVVPVTSNNAGLHPLDAGAAAPESGGVRPRVLLVNAADSARESFELTWKQPGKPVPVAPPDAAPQPAAVPSATAAATSTTTPTATPTPTTPTSTTATPTAAPPTTAAPSDPPVVKAYVPPGKSRVVRAPPIPPGDFAELVLTGDDEPFDNRLWIVPPSREQVRVLHLAREPSDDPQSLRYYLERAFDDASAGRRVTVETVDPAGAGIRVPTPRDLENVGLVVVALDGPSPQGWSDAIGNWIDEGGSVVAVLHKPEAEAWRSLLPTELRDPKHIAVEEADKSIEYALLSEIDLRHPLFAPLNDPRFSDFTKIRFWQHRRLTFDYRAASKVRFLARFDTGRPAIVEVPRGKGRIFLLASGWQPRESQLGVSSKFIPLVFTLLDLGKRSPVPVAQYEVGEPIELAAPPTEGGAGEGGSDAAWTVRNPAGREWKLAAGPARFVPDDGPGVYEFRAGGATHRAAVNIPAEESKTTPLGPEALEAVGVRLAKEVPEPTPESQAEHRTLQLAEIEARQQLWRPLLAAAIALAIFETWFAGRSGRGEDVAAVPAAAAT